MNLYPDGVSKRERIHWLIANHAMWSEIDLSQPQEAHKAKCQAIITAMKRAGLYDPASKSYFPGLWSMMKKARDAIARRK